MFSYFKIGKETSWIIFYSKRLIFVDEHFSSPEESRLFDLRVTNILEKEKQNKKNNNNFEI